MNVLSLSLSLPLWDINQAQMPDYPQPNPLTYLPGLAISNCTRLQHPPFFFPDHNSINIQMTFDHEAF